MTIKTTFLTASRDDIIGLAQNLAQQLRPEALTNRSKAVLWSNSGSLNAAKSLLAEEMARSLEVAFTPNPFRHKPHSGYSTAGHPFKQVQFYDIMFPHLAAWQYRRTQQYRQKQKISEALMQQKHGGIIFIHNAAQAARQFHPDIEMKILSRRRIRDFFNPVARFMPSFTESHLEQCGLRNEYTRTMERLGDSRWMRLHAITIHNPEIFKPDFIRQLALAQAFDAGYRESPPPWDDACFPVPIGS